MEPESELSLAGQVAEQAEFIVNSLQQTDYQYTENIDVDNGVYDCDCSQFANFVLSGTAPDHYATLVAAAAEPVPRAFGPRRRGPGRPDRLAAVPAPRAG
jgi:hypothetical protein